MTIRRLQPTSGSSAVVAVRSLALLTDFGTRDHYAGTMKAVVLGVCPDATLVDIGHEIPPHDVHGRRARARARAIATFRSARSSWWSWIQAWARRGAASPPTRRLSIRGAGQRRADRACFETRRRRGRRADRAQIRAADGQPDLRGTRSICAGCRLPRQGVDVGSLGRAITDYRTIDAAEPTVAMTRIARRGACASIASAT